MTYKDQLKDARWKSKRSNIIERDQDRCVYCDSSKKLQVHHKYYLPDLMAWEYPNEALITLCKDCHELEECRFTIAAKTIMMDLRIAGFDAMDIQSLVCSVKRISANNIAGASEIVDLLHNFSALPKNDRLALAHISEKLYYVPSTINYGATINFKYHE